VNFTIFDQTSLKEMNSTWASTWDYWIGSGSVKKRYSFSNTGTNTSRYNFCFNNNFSIYADADILFTNSSYIDGSYYYREQTLTNITTLVSLYLLSSIDTPVKFTITVKNGLNFISNSIIYILKYYVSEGVYKLVSVKEIDSDGKISEYLQLDKKYQFIVNNVSIYKTSICESSPCSMTLFINENPNNLFQSFYDTYDSNVVSNLTYNSDTNITTYTFLDTMGTTNFFRLLVTQNVIGGSTSITICDVTLNSYVGTITCDLSGYYGDFTAIGYVDRQPEKIDKIIGFSISEIKQNFGKMEIIFLLGIMITMVFAGAVVSRGNPTVVLTFFVLSLIGTKLMNINPFSWALIALVCLVTVFIISKVRT
jgi:hypothetical protein